MSYLFYLTFWSFLGLAKPAVAGPFTDGSQLLSACNQAKYSKACLTGLMTFRCAAYSSDSFRTGQCLDAAGAMADVLDIVAPAVDGSIAFVAFTGEVKSLLNEPFTQRYLKAVKEGLERGRFGEAFELWEFTLRTCRGNTAAALRMIGVLLQDTSADKFHLSYVGEKYADSLPEETLALLSDVLDLLEPQGLVKRKTESWLKLYPFLPENREAHFRTNLYHFYAISYLAMRVKWKTRNERLSRFLPLLLEATYKFRKIAPERWPLADPKTLDPVANAAELADLYTAYVGARWGAGASSIETLSFEEFSRRMAKSPYEFLRSLYLDK